VPHKIQKSWISDRKVIKNRHRPIPPSEQFLYYLAYKKNIIHYERIHRPKKTLVFNVFNVVILVSFV